MTTTGNLWPEFALDEVIRSPKMILNEQADFLAKGTKNLLTANIKSYVDNLGDLIHDFFIVVPNLNGYKYYLFSIAHDTVLLYPCFMKETEEEGVEWQKVNDENELLDVLKQIFNSERTKMVIRSLVSQSRENLAPTVKF